MFKKLKLILDLFRKGNSVSNAEVWKSGGNAAFYVAALLTAAVKLAEGFGYAVELDGESVTAIAGGVVAVVMFVINNITSKKVGILPAADKPADVIHEGIPSVEYDMHTGIPTEPSMQDKPESNTIEPKRKYHNQSEDIYFG